MSGKSEKDSKRNMQQEAAGTGGKSSAGAQEKIRAKKQYKKNFTGLLFGEFLTSEVLRKNIGFILLVAFCMLLYIGNGYSSQQELIELNKLKEEVEDVKYNALIRSSELLERSRQSHIEEHLKSIGDTMLQTATISPFVIKVDTTE